MREQCSVLSENTVALQLMFVKRSTKQNHNVSVDRVETGDVNEEADSTINVGLKVMGYRRPRTLKHIMKFIS